MTTAEHLSTAHGAAPDSVRPPTPRGPASATLLELLTGDIDRSAEAIGALGGHVDDALAAVEADADPAALLHHDDVQLTLFVLNLLHYGPAPYVVGDWEWDPDLLVIRARIEGAFERVLRDVVDVPAPASADGSGVSATLFEMTDAVAKPSLAMWAGRKATEEQLRELLILRTIYTLREADPHSWAIPRLRGRAKAALIEIQADEYGNGRPDRMHAEIFARTLRAMGLSDVPDAYVDRVPAVTLTSLNMMSLFGLHRRLRGAIVGHLAAYEMTSSIPNKHYARAFRRHGHGDDVTHYFDEHVEADAVHEQIAGRDLAGGLADDEPELIDDILFGAAASLHMDDLIGAHMDAAWQEGRSALRDGEGTGIADTVTPENAVTR
ncbi:iron-containing redox enzyme family protein [uncultured Corynebacterium sp.]|uniref:iron-containing redox enzyme family protein n=1 Tax=uncultured Corynebacterium sp. TaxID=159447 RepID=UPI0025D140A9|nr:iron-containing redox enzyme family protein [uncultured Corynebacterium sp.]